MAADILDGFDESEIEGSAVGEIAFKVRQAEQVHDQWISCDDLGAQLQAIPQAVRQGPATLSVGGKVYTVVGLTSDGVLHVEEMPF